MKKIRPIGFDFISTIVDTHMFWDPMCCLFDSRSQSSCFDSFFWTSWWVSTQWLRNSKWLTRGERRFICVYFCTLYSQSLPKTVQQLPSFYLYYFALDPHFKSLDHLVTSTLPNHHTWHWQHPHSMILLWHCEQEIGNYVYQRRYYSQEPSPRGQSLNIFTWFIGSGGESEWPICTLNLRSPD